MKQVDQKSMQFRQVAGAKLPRVSKLMEHSPDVLLHELQVQQIELEMQNEKLRLAQVKLEESRDNYIDFYDFAPVGYITFNREGMIDAINLTGAALLVLERNKLIGRRFASFVAPEDRDTWHNHFRNVLTHDNALTCELKLLRRDDTWFYAQLDCLYICRVGRPHEVRIVLTDITKRKHTEMLLRASEKNLKESQAIAGVGSYLLDIRSGLWKSSQVLDQLFGIDDAYEHSVEGWEALLHPEDRTRMINYLNNEVIGQRKIFDQKFRIIRHHDQAERWVHALGKLELDGQGRPLKMHGTLQDITALTAAEAKMNDLAFYDTLTRLPNRRLLEDRLDKSITASKRSGLYGVAMFLDLDNFKPLNDTHGHKAGGFVAGGGGTPSRQ